MHHQSDIMRFIHGRKAAQAFAVHKSADMTSVYRDVRGDEWVKVRV